MTEASDEACELADEVCSVRIVVLWATQALFSRSIKMKDIHWHEYPLEEGSG